MAEIMSEVGAIFFADKFWLTVSAVQLCALKIGFLIGFCRNFTAFTFESSHGRCYNFIGQLLCYVMNLWFNS